MNILLIGNGFDLAHGLPTSYKDFLEFCQKAMRIYTYSYDKKIEFYEKNNLENWNTNELIKNFLYDCFKNRDTKFNDDSGQDYEIVTPNTILNEFYDCVKKNAWLQYFLERVYYIGKNWIDFESEISNVIQAIDLLRNIIEENGKISDLEGLKINERTQKIIHDIIKKSGKNFQDTCIDLNKIDDFAGFLNIELNRLIRALEIYIDYFINQIEIIEKNKDIEKLEIDCVLSFNYSNTYTRVYDKSNKVQCDYIHGKADLNHNLETCNLVLGIDEYLDDNKKNKELYFLEFKKFYQRIYKSTGNLYMDWLNGINKSPYESNLYIFGHSLDKTDRDILKLFISNDKVHTKIFYYRKNEDDKHELSKIIKNLISILGQKELIERTCGINKTIEFIPQSLSETIKEDNNKN